MVAMPLVAIRLMVAGPLLLEMTHQMKVGGLIMMHQF